MSSLLTNIPRWVEEADASNVTFRQAVHSVLEGIARNQRLRSLLCMKGGILLALHYDSPRFTTDIDFSTPEPFSTTAEEETTQLLSDALISITEELGYDIDCRLQGYRVQPGRDKTFVTIEMRIGYALKGTKAHARLLDGQSPNVLSVDYSFCESIPEVEEVDLSEDGTLRVYSLPTLVAEKFRSLLQQPIRRRTRRQDIFDLHYLLKERPELQAESCKARVLADLLVKCEDRNIVPTQDSMEQQEVHDMAAQDYDTLQDELAEGQLPEFERAFLEVVQYYRNLPWPSP